MTRKIEPGMVFNKLTIIYEVLDRGGRNRIVYCVCECNKYKIIRLQHLVDGKIISCGCHRDRIRTKHGLHNHRLYGTWNSMIDRCKRKNMQAYHRYGGRGIKVCDRWLVIQNFIDDMYPSYKEGLELDRIDNDGDYSPENCRWVTPKENSNNKSDSIKYNGECISDISMRLGGNPRLVSSRIRKGWTLEEACNTRVLPKTCPKNRRKLSTDKF